MAQKETEAPTINSVLRAIDVVQFLADADMPTVGVTDIADSLKLSKAVIYRILTSLRMKGLVEMDETTHRYRLGPQALVIGEAYRSRLDFRDLCRDEMAHLVRNTNETATLSIRHGYLRTYIDQITPGRIVKMMVQIGHTYPLHSGASSKAFLAHLSSEEQLECVEQAFEADSIPSIATLQAELALIRERGWAMSLGERDPSAGSVAAPVFSAESLSPIAVISVCGPITRFADEVDAIAKLTIESATRVSERLGSSFQPSTLKR